jgi:hypothetical protein
MLAVLIYKWPIFLIINMAFPVVTAWAPYVQFLAFILMHASAVHAMVRFGKKLMTNLYIIGACRATDAAFSWPVSLMGWGTNQVTHGDGGGALHCEYYLLAMWFMCLSVVFWQSLLWRIRNEQKERREYLQSLGIHSTVAWPKLKVMVTQLVILQLYLTVYFMLSLEDLFLLASG